MEAAAVQKLPFTGGEMLGKLEKMELPPQEESDKVTHQLQHPREAKIKENPPDKINTRPSLCTLS